MYKSLRKGLVSLTLSDDRTVRPPLRGLQGVGWWPETEEEQTAMWKGRGGLHIQGLIVNYKFLHKHKRNKYSPASLSEECMIKVSFCCSLMR